MYASLDPQIRRWADRHALVLHTTSGEGEIRAAYVSSLSGECFRIWVDPPADGRTCVHAACVEGRTDALPPSAWPSTAVTLETTLDTAFRTVTGWMAPSGRFVPETRRHGALRRFAGIVSAIFNPSTKL